MVGIWDVALIGLIFIYRQQILDFITKAGQSITPTATQQQQPPPAPSGPSTSPSPSAPAAPATPPAKNQTGTTPLQPNKPTPQTDPFTTGRPSTSPPAHPAKNQTGGTPKTVSAKQEQQILNNLHNQRATQNIPDPCAAFISSPSTYAQCRKAHNLSINIGYVDYGYDAGSGYEYPYDTYDYIPEEYESYFLGF